MPRRSRGDGRRRRAVGGDAAGQRLNFAPRYSLSGHGEAGTGPVVARIEASYRSRRYFTPANQAPSAQDGHALVNASVVYTNVRPAGVPVGLCPQYARCAFVTNTAGLGAAVTGNVGPPRRFGLELEWTL